MLSTDMTSLLSRAAKVCYHNQKQRGSISISLTTEQIFWVFFSPKDDVFKLKDLKLFNPPPEFISVKVNVSPPPLWRSSEHEKKCRVLSL